VPANAGPTGKRARLSPASAATRSGTRTRRRRERGRIGVDSRITVPLVSYRRRPTSSIRRACLAYRRARAA
jgi:hypothetical protein